MAGVSSRNATVSFTLTASAFDNQRFTPMIKPYDHCYYCRSPLDGNNPMTGRKTREHKQPLSRGGANDSSNVVWACYQCNQTKGDMTELEFRAWISIGRPNKREYLRAIGRR